MGLQDILIFVAFWPFLTVGTQECMCLQDIGTQDYMCLKDVRTTHRVIL